MAEPLHFGVERVRNDSVLNVTRSQEQDIVFVFAFDEDFFSAFFLVFFLVLGIYSSLRARL